MRLNRATLLDTICKIRETHSLLSLRDEICKLRNRLNRPDSNEELFSVDALEGGDIIEFNIDSLLNELRQAEKALTLERAKYYIKRLEKSITEPKTSPINDIDLHRWKEYTDIITDSLWILDRRDNSGVHTAGYWGNFIPQIPNQMIKRYTKKGDWIIDTFAGCGTTLIESQRLGRNSIGIELQEDIAEQARRLINTEPNRYNTVQEIFTGDSAVIDYMSILQRYGQNRVQLVIMHPPYHDIIRFSNDHRDLSNASSLESFLAMLNRVASNALSVLDKDRYLVLVIGDKYVRGEWIPLGFAAMNEIMKLGCKLKSIIVKNFDNTTGKRTQKELWRYRALVGGFYIFKHEYIFLFKNYRSHHSFS